MKELHFCFAFFLFLFQNIHCQSLIRGIVLDLESKEPLIQATISIDGTPLGTVTDFEGRFELHLEAGNYTLSFRFLGYQSISRQIIVDGVHPLVLDIALKGEIVSDVIVITEGKYEKKLEESTVSIDVINAKQIQNNNVRSLDDIVAKTSGVQIMDGQVSIRGGAGYAYGAGSRVAFLVDGQQLLSAELSDVKWNFVPIENAEQIEIIKGSASVLYGSGALNGVINVRTAYPTTKPYTCLTTYAGVYEQPPVDSMRWFNPKLEPLEFPMFTGVFFSHREKLKENFDLVLGANVHFENGFIKSNDECRFRLNFNTRYRQPNTDGKFSYGINGNIMYHEQGTYILAQDMRKNAYRNIVETGYDRYLSATIDPYVTYYDTWKNRHDLRGRWFTISKQRGARPSVGNVFSGEYQFHSQFGKDWNLTAGMLAQRFQAFSILFDDNDTNTVEDRSLFGGNSFAAYAQLEKKFFDKLNITIGTRWEGFLIDSVFTPMKYPLPRFGANYKVSDLDFLRASFGAGFRFPSLTERFINEPIPLQGLSLNTFPNPDIRPEKGWTAELAYRRTFRTEKFKLYTDVALFWMEYKDMVEFALVYNSTIQQIGFQSINISQARIAGWEISGQTEGNIGKTPLRIWGGYTYSYAGDLAEDTTQQNIGVYVGKLFNTFVNGVVGDSSNILRYRSLHNFRFDAQTEWKGFTCGFSANYNSHIHKIDYVFTFSFVVNGLNEFRAIHNKGSLIFDWRFGYRFNKKQHLNFIVNNLLNTEYASRPARMGAPRTFTMKYTHVF